MGTPVSLALLAEDPRAQELLSDLLAAVFTASEARPGDRRWRPARAGGPRPAGPAGLAAHPLAVLAFLAWWQDETVIAGEAAQRAAEDQGGSSLAGLVSKALGVGL